MTAWTSQAESRETAENDSCRHSHTCDKSRVASAAIVTALLQGKPACKQKNSGTKQVKTIPKWLRGLRGWKQQVNFNGCKKKKKNPMLFFWEVMHQKQKDEHKQGWFPINHCYKKFLKNSWVIYTVDGHNPEVTRRECGTQHRLCPI